MPLILLFQAYEGRKGLEMKRGSGQSKEPQEPRQGDVLAPSVCCMSRSKCVVVTVMTVTV